MASIRDLLRQLKQAKAQGDAAMFEFTLQLSSLLSDKGVKDALNAQPNPDVIELRANIYRAAGTCQIDPSHISFGFFLPVLITGTHSYFAKSETVLIDAEPLAALLQSKVELGRVVVGDSFFRLHSVGRASPAALSAYLQDLTQAGLPTHKGLSLPNSGLEAQMQVMPTQAARYHTLRFVFGALILDRADVAAGIQPFPRCFDHPKEIASLLEGQWSLRDPHVKATVYEPNEAGFAELEGINLDARIRRNPPI